MISIMQVQAPYFFSLAALLLERNGTKDPFGLSYVDERAEIRGTPDGASIQVRNKGIASNVPDMIVASRGPEGETFAREHNILASHLQWKVAKSFEGEHAFTFLLSAPDDSTVEMTILANDLDDAYDYANGDRKGVVRDLLKVMSREEALASGLSEASIPVTPALVQAHELAACMREAADSADEVYVFTYMPADGKSESWRAKLTPHIRAVDLRDAEETARTVIPAGHRISKVEIETLPEFYRRRGGSAAIRAATLMSGSVTGRGSGKA